MAPRDSFTCTECSEKLEEERLGGVCTLNTYFVGELRLVNFANEVGLWLEDRERVVKTVEFEELLDELGHERALLRLAQLFGARVIEMERALA